MLTYGGAPRRAHVHSSHTKHGKECSLETSPFSFHGFQEEGTAGEPSPCASSPASTSITRQPSTDDGRVPGDGGGEASPDRSPLSMLQSQGGKLPSDGETPSTSDAS